MVRSDLGLWILKFQGGELEGWLAGTSDILLCPFCFTASGSDPDQGAELDPTLLGPC